MTDSEPLAMDYDHLLNWWSILNETIHYPETAGRCYMFHREMREIENILQDIENPIHIQ